MLKKTILAPQNIFYEQVSFITNFVTSMNVKYYIYSGIGEY